MSYNPFERYLNQNVNKENNIQEGELDFDNSIVDHEIDRNIIADRNQSFRELSQELENLPETWRIVSEMVQEQGQILDMAAVNIEKSETNTKESVEILEKSREHIKDRLIMIRDISIVIGGIILGAGGFLIGPIVGVGTIIAGSAAGGAIVTGLHKIVV